MCSQEHRDFSLSRFYCRAIVSPQEEQVTSIHHPTQLIVAKTLLLLPARIKWSGLSLLDSLSVGGRLPKHGWMMELGPEHPCITKHLGYRFKKKTRTGTTTPAKYPTHYNKGVAPREVSHCPVPSSKALIQRVFPEEGTSHKNRMLHGSL